MSAIYRYVDQKCGHFWTALLTPKTDQKLLSEDKKSINGLYANFTKVQNIDIFNPLELSSRGLKLFILKSQKLKVGQWSPLFSHLLMDRLNLAIFSWLKVKLEFYLLKNCFLIHCFVGLWIWKLLGGSSIKIYNMTIVISFIPIRHIQNVQCGSTLESDNGLNESMIR